MRMLLLIQRNGGCWRLQLSSCSSSSAASWAACNALRRLDGSGHESPSSLLGPPLSGRKHLRFGGLAAGATNFVLINLIIRHGV